MKSLSVIALALMMWALTVVRIRDLMSKKEKEEIAKIICAMLLFSSMTLTFKIDEFAVFFDAHTLPNLSLLGTHFSFVASQYFLTVTTLTAIGTPSTKRVISWIRFVLFLLIAILLVIYVLYISKMPPYNDSQPQSLPIVIFKFVSYPYGIMLCVLMLTTYLAYLPSEKFSVMRLRAIMIILANLMGGIFILSRMVIFAGYFWPFLLSESLLTISNVLLVCAVGLFFGALLSDRIYARFVVMSRSLESWRTFQDLKYLVERLLLLCPVVALPTNNPPVWKFLSNPEYYLYRAIVIILDGRTMLADFLSESTIAGEPPLWEDEMLREAVRVNQAMQSINPSDEFLEIVDAYRRVSQDLFKNQNYVV